MITAGVRKRGLGVANLYRYSSANEKIHIQSIENTIIYNVFSSCIFMFMYTLEQRLRCCYTQMMFLCKTKQLRKMGKVTVNALFNSGF